MFNLIIDMHIMVNLLTAVKTGFPLTSEMTRINYRIKYLC